MDGRADRRRHLVSSSSASTTQSMMSTSTAGVTRAAGYRRSAPARLPEATRRPGRSTPQDDVGRVVQIVDTRDAQLDHLERCVARGMARFPPSRVRGPERGHACADELTERVQSPSHARSIPARPAGVRGHRRPEGMARSEPRSTRGLGPTRIGANSGLELGVRVEWAREHAITMTERSVSINHLERPTTAIGERGMTPERTLRVNARATTPERARRPTALGPSPPWRPCSHAPRGMDARSADIAAKPPAPQYLL